MSEYTIKSVNCETGEEEIRPMTKEEIATHLQLQKDFVEKVARQKVEVEAIEAKRNAVLEKLGLTAEEAKALLS